MLGLLRDAGDRRPGGRGRLLLLVEDRWPLVSAGYSGQRLEFLEAASSSAVLGDLFWRWSFARRPENA
ncbi:MAG: hypothetical protein M3065_09545, partial [Actinomycetota bacterium]|nr:hypothetical protein [Actinomycetota bacterium]